VNDDILIEGKIEISLKILAIQSNVKLYCFVTLASEVPFGCPAGNSIRVALGDGIADHLSIAKSLLAIIVFESTLDARVAF
jgi:hypothetical protein